jgi:superoxide reductase
MEDGIKFYRCNNCGNLAFMLVASGVNPDCCGEPMNLLNEVTDANNPDATKHKPVVEVNGKKVIVRVGNDLHPMFVEHRIEWIALVDGRRVDIQKMATTGEPIAEFQLHTDSDSKDILRAFAFCNLHGLWEADAWE